jgi:predicted acyl esterase
MNQATKLIAVVALCCGSAVFPARFARAQGRPQDQALIDRRNAIEKELESTAIIERKVMVPMRDGKRMQADIYRPKDESKKYPIIFVRTPYNFNYWDVELGAPRDMSAQRDAVKHGYIYIEMNERGRYFSEGEYDILGTPSPTLTTNWNG